MKPETPEELRIRLEPLEPREPEMDAARLRRTLGGLTGGPGMPCQLDCECAVGLVCRDGRCTGDW